MFKIEQKYFKLEWFILVEILGETRSCRTTHVWVNMLMHYGPWSILSVSATLSHHFHQSPPGLQRSRRSGSMASWLDKIFLAKEGLFHHLEHVPDSKQRRTWFETPLCVCMYVCVLCVCTPKTSLRLGAKCWCLLGSLFLMTAQIWSVLKSFCLKNLFPSCHILQTELLGHLLTMK